MRTNHECKKCGNRSYYIVEKGTQTGLYCKNCNSWITWINKDEKNYLISLGTESKEHKQEEIQEKKEEIICKQCSNDNFYKEKKGNHIGLYCDACGKWQKWLSKKEEKDYKTKEEHYKIKEYLDTYEMLKATSEEIETKEEPQLEIVGNKMIIKIKEEIYEKEIKYNPFTGEELKI